jgi:putative ABC transport system permease protein
MIRYYIKLGVLSIRKNPILSALMVAAIAVGISACMTILNINYVMSGNPIPHRSDVVFHVQLDSWDPNQSADDGGLTEPPNQVTYLDGTALLKARKARRQVLSYQSSRVVQPADRELRPFEVNARSTTADFFPMFDAPFLYGRGWDQAADDSREQVVVLGKEVNERMFGGENSVGRTVMMNDDVYRVVGVLDDWPLVPRFYDVTTQAFNETEELFFPFSVSVAKEVGGNGNTNCWKPWDEAGWNAFLNSECVWMQMWVELHGADEKQDYMAFLDAYVESQKAIGRFPRPLNNRLNDVMEWMADQEVVADDVQVLLGLAILFLIVCLLNTIGLLLAKIMRRSGDISLRRALGASRNAIFSQYIIEAGVIGLCGGILGIGLTWLGLRGIEVLYRQYEFVENLVKMDWVMILAAVALAIISALGAALYPTWRACRIQPAAQLKTL